MVVTIENTGKTLYIPPNIWYNMDRINEYLSTLNDLQHWEVLFKRRGNDWRYTPVVLASFCLFFIA